MYIHVDYLYFECVSTKILVVILMIEEKNKQKIKKKENSYANPIFDKHFINSKMNNRKTLNFHQFFKLSKYLNYEYYILNI